MSKAKKAAFAEKQRMAVVTTDARSLVPLAGSAPATAPSKKVKARKQSRGK